MDGGTQALRGLLTCTIVCCSHESASAETYEHVFRLCLHPLLLRGRTASDILLNQLPTINNLERLLLPKVLKLVRSPDGRMLCPGNCSTPQLY